MTKKHFIELADVIRTVNSCTTGPDGNHYHIEPFTERQIDELAAFCRSVNPRFNRERWIAYIKGECGPNGGKK